MNIVRGNIISTDTNRTIDFSFLPDPQTPTRREITFVEKDVYEPELLKKLGEPIIISLSSEVYDDKEAQTWSPDEIIEDFQEGLDALNQSRPNTNLSIDRRKIVFLTPDEIKPTESEEISYYVKKYGEYVLDDIVGKCSRNEAGDFTLQIGKLGDKSATKNDVIEIVAHEYGHTLGEFLDDPVMEELKAYTFSSLFKKINNDGIKEITVCDEASNVHQMAIFRLQQLLQRDVPGEAILAYLIDARFGNYKSADLLDMIR